MKIIYLHGFNSSGETTTAIKLKEFFPTLKSISYNFENADISFNQINDALRDELEEDKDLIIVGTSLGGFWANFFGQKYNVKSVLINPTIEPSESLKKYIGENINYVTHKKIFFSEQEAFLYKKFERETIKGYFRIIILGVNDNINNYQKSLVYFKNKGTIVILNEGHRILNIKKLSEIILDASNYYPES